MSIYELSHLTDHTLLRGLATLVTQDRTTTAELLAHIAEVDARQLYLPAAYPSMYAYCVGELRMSEDMACKRIAAARAAQQFPAIFVGVAEGRLHLSAVVMLAPHLTSETADELLAAATHKTKPEIELLLAQRFPQPDLPTRVQAIPPPSVPTMPTEELASGRIELSAPGRIDVAVARPKVTPLSPQRFALQVTMSQSTHDKLRHAQALLGHAVPSGDVAEVLDRALDALIRQLEKRKLAATSRPRRGQRRFADPRHISANVRRTVWARDGGRCTFVSEAGQRCPARTRLEYDHIDPVARGGQATVAGIRLRCRAHNQYAAERTFGTAFMQHKREQARRAAAQEKSKRAAADAETAAEKAHERDVVPWLRRLGFRADECRHASEHCESIPDASLEERIRAALSFLAPGHPGGHPSRWEPHQYGRQPSVR